MEQNQRTKLELEIGEPRVLDLLFDQPLTGENRYGPYYLYAFADPESGQEYSFFAPDATAHDKLSMFKAGDSVRLLKSARQSGRRVITELSITPANGVAAKAENGNGKAVPASSSKPDSLFEVLEQCYADAIKMQERFNGMVDVNRIAITLFIARSRTNGHSITANLT